MAVTLVPLAALTGSSPEEAPAVRFRTILVSLKGHQCCTGGKIQLGHF